MVKEFDNRRKFLVNGLQKIKGIEISLPEGAFYVFPNISRIESNSVKFCKNLIEKEKVATVPGSAFMAEGHMPIGMMPKKIKNSA